MAYRSINMNVAATAYFFIRFTIFFLSTSLNYLGIDLFHHKTKFFQKIDLSQLYILKCFQ